MNINLTIGYKFRVVHGTTNAEVTPDQYFVIIIDKIKVDGNDKYLAMICEGAMNDKVITIDPSAIIEAL